MTETEQVINKAAGLTPKLQWLVHKEVNIKNSLGWQSENVKIQESTKLIVVSTKLNLEELPLWALKIVTSASQLYDYGLL